MPDYSDGKAGLTEAEKAIVRGMNGALQRRAEGWRGATPNIGAVHFDGPVLEDCLKAYWEVTDLFQKSGPNYRFLR